ncbi:hypothetical protein D3C79_1009030 [compost metagenome]
MVAQVEEGKLIASRGVAAKVEQVELNHVKIVRGDVEEFVRLGTTVRWMPEGMVH